MVNKRLAEKLSREWIDARLKVTEEELCAAYEEHLLGWEIWPAHILSATEEDARAIIRQLEAGANFSELARQHSLADDADKGGNLGAFFDQAGAVPSLRDGTFHLEEGQVSEPIRTIDGYEVVKVLKKRRIPFEKLRADIAEQVGQRKWAQRRRAVIDSLKEVRSLRYHRDRIHAVLAALHGRALDQPHAPLIEYGRGRALVAVMPCGGSARLRRERCRPTVQPRFWLLNGGFSRILCWLSKPVCRGDIYGPLW